MKDLLKKLLLLLVVCALSGALWFLRSGSDPVDPVDPVDPNPGTEQLTVLEDEWYSTKEEVSLYLQTYNHLPDNYLTKDEAEELGWVASKGNLWEVAEGMSIGGDVYGNREGLLPKKKGRKYYECDIDYEGGQRNAKRIVFSSDGLIFYTDDHYASFETLVGEDE
ncbi:MAG: ribonuclease [Erysipelotrichaceae bacterium]|nr:ribonuclease [Erysipelotrichaceae bacterium]